MPSHPTKRAFRTPGPFLLGSLLLWASAAVGSVRCECDGSIHKDGFFCEPYCAHKRGGRGGKASSSDDSQKALNALRDQAVGALLQSATQGLSDEEKEKMRLEQAQAQEKLQADLNRQEEQHQASQKGKEALLENLKKLESLDDDERDLGQASATAPAKTRPPGSAAAGRTLVQQKGVLVSAEAEGPQKDRLRVQNNNDYAVDVHVYMSNVSSCNCLPQIKTVTVPPRASVEAGWISNTQNKDPWPYKIGIGVSKHSQGASVNYAP